MREERDLFKEVEGLKRRVEELEGSRGLSKAAIDGAIKGVGAVGGAAFGYGVIGHLAQDFARFLGETWHGIDLAIKLGKNYFWNTDSVERYLGKIDVGIKESYLKNISEEAILADIFVEGLEAGMRGAHELPGAQSRPVKKFTGIKDKIFEITKGFGKSKEKKEEAKIQGSELYKEHYNNLARLRMSAVENRELLKGEIVSQSRKLEQNEYNTGKVDEQGHIVFENLVRGYNDTSDILRHIWELDIREINEGSLNKKYEKVVSDAKEYGIIPYSARHWGDAGVLGITLFGAFVGYKMSRPLAGLAQIAWNTGDFVVRTGYKGAKYMGKSIIGLGNKIFRKEKEINREKESE